MTQSEDRASRQEKIFISVRNGRAFLSRYLQDQHGSFIWESAVNAHEVEHEAIEAVKAQGGDLSQHGDYDCPPELAAKAQWHDYHIHSRG